MSILEELLKIVESMPEDENALGMSRSDQGLFHIRKKHFTIAICGKVVQGEWNKLSDLTGLKPALKLMNDETLGLFTCLKCLQGVIDRYSEDD